MHPSRAREASHTIDTNASDREDRERGELETRFKTLVEQIPAIVYVWSVKGSLDEVVEEFVSPQIEEVLGFRSEEWMANPSLWIDAVHPDDREEVIGETTRSVEAGEPFKMEYRMLAKDGRIVWLHDVASVVSRDEQGRATGTRVFSSTSRRGRRRNTPSAGCSSASAVWTSNVDSW